MAGSVVLKKNKIKFLPEFKNQNSIFYLYIMPLALLITLFGIYPIAKSIQMSFLDSSTALSDVPKFIGMSNYGAIFQDSYFRDSLKITLLYTALSVPFNVVVAFLVALMIENRFITKGKLLFKLAVFIPVVTPDVVSSIIWKWMYNQDFGAVNAIMSSLGLPAFGGIANPKTVIIALAIVELWKHFGFYTIIFITNLQMVDKSVLEAADIDGAGYWKKITNIILPDLKPALTLNLVYAVIQFLKTFTVALVMTQGGPNYSSNFLSFYAYSKFMMAQYGEATAMATVLFAIVIIMSGVAYKMNKGDQK